MGITIRAYFPVCELETRHIHKKIFFECKHSTKEAIMSDQDKRLHSSVSWTGGVSGVVVQQMLDEDWTPSSDSPATHFSTAIDGALHLTAEVARHLIGAHQGAAAMILK